MSSRLIHFFSQFYHCGQTIFFVTIEYNNTLYNYPLWILLIDNVYRFEQEDMSSRLIHFFSQFNTLFNYVLHVFISYVYCVNCTCHLCTSVNWLWEIEHKWQNLFSLIIFFHLPTSTGSLWFVVLNLHNVNLSLISSKMSK
jgi:hypothetical protein